MPQGATYNNTEINKVLEALDNAAKTLGKAGIILVADVQSGAAQVDKYISEGHPFAKNIYKWHYSWGSDIPNSISSAIRSEYENYSNCVASIPMGFDKTPWEPTEVGLMTADEVKSICSNVKATYDKQNGDDLNLFMFTCWDEWGEGHFYAPSSQQGFGYMDAI